VRGFGAFLASAGQANVAQSFAVTGSFFYEVDALPALPERWLNDHVRCVYVVRGGFTAQPERFTANGLAERWRSFGLAADPSFYAELVIETPLEDPSFSGVVSAVSSPATQRPLAAPPNVFRVRPVLLLVNRFQDPSRSGRERDIVIAFEFANPGGVTQSDDTNRTLSLDVADNERFAIGYIALPDVRAGERRGVDQLSGIQTGWMNFPLSTEVSPVGHPFNLVTSRASMRPRPEARSCSPSARPCPLPRLRRR
jgi:hypothetical protein